MPPMWKPNPIAILCSDLHLSLNQPACRADDNWLAVQAHYLSQLKEIADGLPIICAGDIFDRWNVEPELIHFVLEHLPNGMICVPGQHDLPNHRLDQVHRSGYGVLVKAGKIRCIAGKEMIPVANVLTSGEPPRAFGFGWGQEIEPPPYSHSKGLIFVAVVHQYIWTVGHSYIGAPQESHLSNLMGRLKGYDVATFGDNHKRFTKVLKTGTTVVNCGGFIRRKSDEIDYHPAVWRLMSDGTVEERPFFTTIDRFHEGIKPKEEMPVNMKEFIDGLEALGEHGLNFREAVENYLRGEKVSKRTKEIILRAMEAKDERAH